MITFIHLFFYLINIKKKSFNLILFYLFSSTQYMTSLKQRSKNLTSISLQCFINDITGQGQNHSFFTLLTHPNIHTIKPQFQQLLKLFAEGTFSHYLNHPSKLPKLNEKQIDTLRKLTILTLFKGKQNITLGKLRQQLSMSESEVISILLMMNINGMANVKINQQNGTVSIIKSQIRACSIPEANIMDARIQTLIKKNKGIEQNIQKLIEQIK